jgi:hypothetical protein
MFVRTGKHKKKQKNIFFNYFLIYLVALIRERVVVRDANAENNIY